MRLSLLSNAPDAASLVLLDDGATDTGYALLQGSSFGSPVWSHEFSGPRGTQGARASQGKLANREVLLILRLAGATKDALAAKMSALAETVDDLRRSGGLCRWRSKSQTHFQAADVLTASMDLPTHDNRLEMRLRAVVQVRLVCGPYMLADPMDFDDDFLVDNVNGGEASYSADSGALANLAVSGGQLAGVANLTTPNILIHTGTGYPLGDHEAQVRFSPGSTITSLLCGVVLKRIDASNFLYAYVDDNGTNSRLRIDKVVAGTPTNLASTNLTARMIVSVPVTVRARIEQNVVYADAQVGRELPFSTSAGDASTSIALTSAEIAVFGIGVSGRAGFIFTPQHASAFIDRFTVLPFTYRKNGGGASGTVTTSLLHVRGEVPGDAPAACDVWINHPGTSANPMAFGLLGWAPRGVPNLLQNGGFDATNGTAVTPWQVSAVSGVTGAATSIAVDSSSKFGAYAGLVTTPATINVGATHPIYGRFLAGVTYTARVWVRSAAATHNVRARLGVSGDIASSTAVALSPTWTLHTFTWTPTASVSLAYLAVEQTAATAGTFLIDGACVFEGTIAPSHGRHIEGEGGHPPLAVITGADAVLIDSALSVAADASAKSGYVLRDTSVAGAGEQYNTRHMIDPSLIGADDYAGDELEVEFWGRFYLHTAFTGGVNFLVVGVDRSGNRIAYPSEFGTAGKTIAVPTATGYRTLRLGTLTLSTATTARWCIEVVCSVLPGTNLQQFGIDCLYVLPRRMRAVTPSGKDGGSAYPYLLPNAGPQTKIVSSADLSGTLITPPTDSVQARASGMGGAPIELPPGDVDFLAMVSLNPPETPAGDVDSITDQPPVHLAIRPRWHWLRDA